MLNVVGPQFAVQSKRCGTLLAHVCLIAQVGPFVLDEIVALGKGSLAEIAFVGFFASVGAHVSFNVIGIVESAFD